MKLKFRKFISLTLVLISICGIFVTETFTANAYTTRTRDEAVAWANSQIGKYINVDGAYGNQCVDLIMAYYQYLGVSRVSGHGYQYAYNSLPSGWTRIQNTPSFVPEPGDIVVWTTAIGGGYGHVAIFLYGDTNSFTSLDQNWPKGTSCQKVTHNYNAVWGVIRPDFKSSETDNPTVSNKVEFHSSSVSNISSNAATINTWVNSSGTITKMGFSLSSNGKQFNKIYTNLSAVEWTSFYLSYDLEEYFGKLSPGQTYYYQFFIYNDGVEYTSQINTFRTNGNSYISFDTYDIPGVGEVSAKTRAWMSNSESKNISELGIICAKDMNTGNKTPVTNNVSWSRSYLDYELCEYVGKLDPGTNYYVRYYAIVDGVTYYSDYFIFTTYSKISFRDYGQSGSKVSDISTSIWIENSEAVNMDSVGFAISENGEEYFEIRVYSDKQWTTSYHEYRINDYYKLKPNKQYYVKYYVEVEDVKYYSNIIQITPIDDIVFDTYGNSTINTDTIILDVWFSNDNALNINSLGFLYGNSIYDMKKIQMFYDVTWTRAHMGQNLLNYAYFEPNSKYYCKFYATIGENTYYSNIFDFSTPININNTLSDPNTSTGSDTTVENPSEPTYSDKIGDINGDGVISIADATELQKHLVGLVTLSDEQLAVADTNGDGSVSVADATQIQKYITQLIPTLG